MQSSRPLALALRVIGFIVLVLGLGYGALELTMPSISMDGFVPSTPEQKTAAVVVMAVSVVIGFALLIVARRFSPPPAKPARR